MEQNLVELWKERSAAIAATVKEVSSVEEAFQYIVELCQSGEPHEELLDGSKDTPKIIAAPGLPSEQAATLRAQCEAKGFAFIDKGLRDYVGGLEVGVAWAVAALADTGSCVVNSSDEDTRLATMLPETSVLLVPRSRILAGAPDVAPLLRELLPKDSPAYIAYISGPSRTADIERVLTLGVHGPLALHAILVDDAAVN